MARGKEKPALPDNVVPLRAARRRGGAAGGRSDPARAARTDPVRAAIARSEASAVQALEKALQARTPEARARHARAGLARRCDLETQGLLLRQLYLGELESGDYARARAAAEQLVDVGTMPDVAHHDAARACQAMGDFDAAVAHLVEAARVGPAPRKAFHLSTLGGLLYAIGRADEAVAHLEAAEREGTLPAPLVRGQLVLARGPSCRKGDLDRAYRELAADAAAEGYGRFVLGELAFARGDRRNAQTHLEAFLARTKRARKAAQAALAPEIERATRTLGRIVWN